jgi:hypothetical protein
MYARSRTGIVAFLLTLTLAVGTREAVGVETGPGCRVTGGGTVDACGPGRTRCDHTNPGSCAPDDCASPALRATHGGQVGSPVGVPTAFTPDSPCIAGEWTHVRHVRGGLAGNFHANSFDSLMCACLTCPENPDMHALAGELCNPDDRICGPTPRRAPANKICFSGPGLYAFKAGMRTRSVVFRVDAEDRSEPGGRNGAAPPDRYRMRIWFVDPDTGAGLELRQAVACADATTEDITAPPPDVDDGGDVIRGNQQIHPPHDTTCLVASSTTTTMAPPATTTTTMAPPATTTTTMARPATTTTTTASVSTTTTASTTTTTVSSTTTTTGEAPGFRSRGNSAIHH